MAERSFRSAKFVSERSFPEASSARSNPSSLPSIGVSEKLLANAALCTTWYQTTIAPFAGFGYLPYLHDPDSEQLMNQTEGLVGRTWTAILSAQLGVMFRILPKEDHH